RLQPGPFDLADLAEEGELLAAEAAGQGAAPGGPVGTGDEVGRMLLVGFGEVAAQEAQDLADMLVVAVVKGEQGGDFEQLMRVIKIDEDLFEQVAAIEVDEAEAFAARNESRQGLVGGLGVMDEAGRQALGLQMAQGAVAPEFALERIDRVMAHAVVAGA